MTNIVIVAVPYEHDPVWKMSSEKKPHLTLLYIQKPLDVDAQEIVQFVEHTTKTSLTKFGLEVRERGVLGDEGADVLFFKENSEIRDLRTFRANLLKNDTINKHYLSAEQFPGWIPHLTVGYPDKPAKEPEYGTPMYVEFDRIAVWLGDEEYEGPEFNLKSFHDETPHSEEVMHFGVKGMRWGVRRPTNSAGLVTGTVAEAATKSSGGSSSGSSKSSSSSDHQTMVKNLSKGVENLSTAEIRQITERIKAVNDLKSTTAAEAAKKRSTINKLSRWAGNQALKGAEDAVGKKIRKLTKDTLEDFMGKSTKEKLSDDGGSKKDKKSKDSDDDTKIHPPEDKPSSDSSSKKEAVLDLANAIRNMDPDEDGVYNVTDMPKTKGKKGRKGG